MTPETCCGARCRHCDVWRTQEWELRLGDCIAGMRELTDDSVDVTITDPPYDANTHRNGRRGNKGVAARRSGGLASGGTSVGSADERAFYNCRDLGFDAISQDQMAALAVQLARTTRRWSAIFCSIEMVGDPGGIGWRGHVERAGLQYVRTAFWHKLGSTPQFTGDRPANAAEAIVIAHRPGRKRWNGGGKHGWYEHEMPPKELPRCVDGEMVILDGPTAVYTHPIVIERGHGEVRLHTTQKPLALMQDLVSDFSDPGEIVLDPFAGSGTTGVACRMLGRRFLGWELNPEYHAIATRRLNGDEAKPRPEQPSLFGATKP